MFSYTRFFAMELREKNMEMPRRIVLQSIKVNKLTKLL